MIESKRPFSELSDEEKKRREQENLEEAEERMDSAAQQGEGNEMGKDLTYNRRPKSSERFQEIRRLAGE